MRNEKENLEANSTGEPGILVGERKLTPSTFIIKYNAPIILIVLIVVSTIISPVFLSWINIVNVLRQQTGYLIIAMGLMMCLLTGGIDLSVASVVGFGSIMITEMVTMRDFGIIPAILITLACCALIGAMNGLLIAYLRMAPFIVTLAMSYGAMGLVYIVSKGANRMLTGSDPLIETFKVFGQGNDPLFGLPWRIYLTLMIILIFWFILKYTAYGRLMTATGSNPLAVSLAGINTKIYRFSANVICSALAGLAGILITAASGASSPMTVSGDYTMTAIAGAIIGGGDLGGGKGSVPLTVVGIFIMGLINNIMNLSNVPAYPQWCVKAVVIIVAIFMRSVVNTRTSR